MLSPGETVKERYKVLSVIGEGGMSVVYHVEDLSLSCRWAMKETLDLFPDRDKSDILAQFEKEARILANLHHPRIPRVIDYFSSNGKHYLVEEFIDARPSVEVLQESSCFDEARIARWAMEILDVLEFLHANNVIYRDLKPGNILIDKEDKVYLVDFGIARFFQGNKAKDTVIIGTPGFASPEHYGRGETDARSDIFSLGAPLHFMLTAQDPALRPFHFEIPYRINPAVSFNFSAVVMKCLDLDPNRRYQTVSEFKKVMENSVLPALSHRTQPLNPPPRLNWMEKYRNTSDIFGATTQFLSYFSVFPVSMSISGILTGFVSFLNPLLGLGAGIISFPLLCREFWKRIDKVYQEQDAVILIGAEGINYQSLKMNINSNWQEIMGLKIVKNPDAFWGRNQIKEAVVETVGGKFAFDNSYHNYRRLIDMIITYGQLRMVVNDREYTLYQK